MRDSASWFMGRCHRLLFIKSLLLFQVLHDGGLTGDIKRGRYFAGFARKREILHNCIARLTRAPPEPERAAGVPLLLRNNKAHAASRLSALTTFFTLLAEASLLSLITITTRCWQMKHDGIICKLRFSLIRLLFSVLLFLIRTQIRYEQFTVHLKGVCLLFLLLHLDKCIL